MPQRNGTHPVVSSALGGPVVVHPRAMPVRGGLAVDDGPPRVREPADVRCLRTVSETGKPGPRLAGLAVAKQKESCGCRKSLKVSD